MVIKSMYDAMDQTKKDLMEINQEHLANMLDFAIEELVTMCEDNDAMLIDDSKICTDYESIFNCLKHWSEKRIHRES